jgi:hypothetical protein
MKGEKPNLFKSSLSKSKIQVSNMELSYWDRENVSKEHVNMIEIADWKLICGIPKTLKIAKNIIGSTDVPLNPSTFIQKSRTVYIYAIETHNQLF